MNKTKKPAFLLLLLLMVGGTAMAQVLTCTERLGEAQVAYDEGRIHDLVDDFRSTWGTCLNEESTFTKEERVQAYRLLTLTYLQLDEPDKADEYMLKLLETEPEYIINPAVDPTEFINLYRTFRTDPIFRIGLRGASSGTFQHMQSRGNTSPYTDRPFSSKFTPGFHLGASIEFDLFKNRPILEDFILNPEILYFNKKITENYNDEFWTGTLTTNLSSIQVNTVVHYNLLWKRSIRLHATLGLSADYRLSVTDQIRGELNSEEGEIGAEIIDSPTLNVTDTYNPFDLSILAGGALRLKVGRPWATLDIRYSYGLFQLVENRFDSYDNWVTYGMGQRNNQRLQGIVAHVGIHFPIFRHEKLIFEE